MATRSEHDVPALGEDRTITCEHSNLVLWHGTSLRLMALCSAFLNEGREFNNVDPERDWQKWSSRGSSAFTLYYSALTDSDDTNRVHCVLRAVLDGWASPTPPHNRRLIIDYVACRAECRRLGYASTLVRFARQSASAQRANLYVLAVEDSCPWWMERGFVLEEGIYLNARLNVFPDVHLLRRHDDPCDVGSPADLALLQEDEAGEEESDSEAEEEDDASLAMALHISASQHVDREDDAELAAAIALSLQQT